MNFKARIARAAPLMESLPAKCIAALALGLAGAGGFAPFELAAAAAASIAGLFWLAAKENRPLAGALIGFLWGEAFFSVGLSWTFNSMHVYGGVPAVAAALGVMALAAFLSLVPGAVCALAAWIKASRPLKAMFILPGLWCLGELVRGSWVMGFGWLSIGYAYVDSLFKSWAPAAGVYGVGLVVNLLIGALLVLLTGQQDKRRVVVRAATAIWAGVLALSTVALDLVQWSKPAQSIEVRVVQADLPVAMRLTQSMQAQRAARVEAMSRRSAMSSHIDLIVWPEGVFGYPVQRLGAESLRAVLGTASSMQTELLFNGFSQAAGARVFNSNWLAAPNGERNDLGAQIREVYQKHHLVPFGEFVPAGFRWFVDALGIPMADQSAGPAGGAGPVLAAGIPAALTVCYENMFGEELRQWWRHSNPQVMINLANLGWFAPWAAQQFSQMSVMRALETARPVLQAVNNAGSMLIAPDGTVERSLLPGAQNLDLRLVSYAGEPTLFVRFGNAPAACAALLVVVFGAAAAAVLRRRDARRER